MTRWHGSLRRLNWRHAVIALAAVFLATLSAQSQSRLASQGASCPPTDQSLVTGGQTTDAIDATGAVIQEVKAESFPELTRVDLRVRTFHSQSDYFRTRFSWSRFLLPVRMRYFVDVNLNLFQNQTPSDGVCAILAHELVHVVSLSRGNRIRRFGLVRLLSKRQIAKFERAADLEAIHRGYGDGLRSYRVWVYAHIPPDKLQQKQSNYFSPEEIAEIQKKLQAHRELFAYWRKHVPMNLLEIQNGPR
jgi:hypothetical protein